jgi:hypothetical protein
MHNIIPVILHCLVLAAFRGDKKPFLRVLDWARLHCLLLVFSWVVTGNRPTIPEKRARALI